jgi:adenosylcobinamide amidohydrolase
MLLETCYQGIEIHREEKIVYVKFLTPHGVVSTDRLAGGLREDLLYIYNHQSCEPSGHNIQHELALKNPHEYRRTVCTPYGLPPEQCVMLGTAANMNNLAIRHASYRDLVVVAVCTGGVETNAGRSGDPAFHHEADGVFFSVEDDENASSAVERHGTINTMVFINRELIPGAMIRAVMTATEAKTALLQELLVHSRYSDGLATGTGTDQIAIASQLGGGSPLTSSGNHTKLGELIGKTVHDAIAQALLLQNGLTPESQCSAAVLIARLGSDRDAFLSGVEAHLQNNGAELFDQNFAAIEKDPLTVAAVAALVHIRDTFVWGILPKSCMPEIMSSYGAQIAAAVSGKHDRLSIYRMKLSGSKKSISSETFLDIIYRSVALGFADKWS